MAAATVATVLGTLGAAYAANTWDGGGANASWTTADNWDDNVVPADTSSVTLGTGFGSGSTINGFNARHVGTLTIDTTTDFTLSGSQIYLDAGLTRTVGSAGIQTLSIYDQYSALITGGPNVWNNNSTDGKLVINSMIRYDSGGSITFNGSGTTEFRGTYISQSGGDMTLNDGTLLFNKGASVSILTGTLTIGDGIGAATSAVVRIPVGNAFSQLVSANSLFMYQDGLLELNQANNTVTYPQMTGGRISTTTGLLTINNNGNNSITTYATNTSAVIQGRVALTSQLNHNIIVADGAAGDDLVINANIESAASAISKGGAGTLVLGGSNAYTQATSVNDGMIIVTANHALGTTASGTTVKQGTTLGFRGNVTYSAAEPISISGGNLRNFSGTNSFAGNVSFASHLELLADGGRLDLDGNLNDNGQLYMRLRKTGEGTVAMNGTAAARDYVTVQGGVLLVNGALTSVRNLSVVAGTLGGGGSFDKDVSVSGTLAPGDPVDLAGRSTFTLTAGNLTLNSGSTFSLRLGDLNAGEFGTVRVTTGTVALNSATLEVDASAFVQGDTEVVVWLINKESAGAVSGIFSGVAEGATVTVAGIDCVLTYVADNPASTTGGNDVALIVPAYTPQGTLIIIQ